MLFIALLSGMVASQHTMSNGYCDDELLDSNLSRRLPVSSTGVAAVLDTRVGTSSVNSIEESINL